MPNKTKPKTIRNLRMYIRQIYEEKDIILTLGGLFPSRAKDKSIKLCNSYSDVRMRQQKSADAIVLYLRIKEGQNVKRSENYRSKDNV